ncbi:MAG: hypothetical protein CMA64_05320 [Euryarchaeota archaeon]|nr:hypothetical protein [Euryarchaeota archaeon]
MFNLPNLQGTLPPRSVEDVVVFSCDYDYFDRHGFALAQSINRTLSWMHVHCHIINEGNMNTEVLGNMSDKFNFSYSFEDVNEDFYKSLGKNKKRMKEGAHIFKTTDLDLIARKTYLASARFMRLNQLFPNEHQYILQLDCDTILKTGFHKNDFRALTEHVSAMPKPKDPSTFIASALCLGIGQNGVMFRELLSQRMREAFQKEIYWYVDQDVLKAVMAEWKVEYKKLYKEIPYKWVPWGLKKDDIFMTGKGSKKEDRRFKSAQLNWLPEHWQTPIFREIRNLPIKK